MSRIHALSDIHGHANEFTRVLNAIDLDTHTGDSLILLGDYIDRGPDSAKCLIPCQGSLRPTPRMCDGPARQP